MINASVLRRIITNWSTVVCAVIAAGRADCCETDRVYFGVFIVVV